MSEPCQSCYVAPFDNSSLKREMSSPLPSNGSSRKRDFAIFIEFFLSFLVVSVIAESLSLFPFRSLAMVAWPTTAVCTKPKITEVSYFEYYCLKIQFS